MNAEITSPTTPIHIQAKVQTHQHHSQQQIVHYTFVPTPVPLTVSVPKPTTTTSQKQQPQIQLHPLAHNNEIVLQEEQPHPPHPVQGFDEKIMALELSDELYQLPYNLVQFKAAHNSVQRRETVHQQLQFDLERPWDGGCRGLELDIVQDPSKISHNTEWVFAVKHGGKFSSTSPTLQQCLQQIAEWSDAERKRNGFCDVIQLTIDLKVGACLGSDELFCEKIDEILIRELGGRDRIFTPCQLQRDQPSVLEGARKYGWPTMKELVNKYIIILSGADAEAPVRRRKDFYSFFRSKQRVMFVDLDHRVGGADITTAYYQQQPNKVVTNIAIGHPGWDLLAKVAHFQGYLSRVWKCNNKVSWVRACQQKINIIATDKIKGHEWCWVNGCGFAGPTCPPADHWRPFRTIVGATAAAHKVEVPEEMYPQIDENKDVVVMVHRGYMDVFGIGYKDKAVHHFPLHAIKKKGWHVLGSPPIFDSPSSPRILQLTAARNSDGRIELFGIREADRHVFHIWQKSSPDKQGESGWSGWSRLEGTDNRIAPSSSSSSNTTDVNNNHNNNHNNNNQLQGQTDTTPDQRSAVPSIRFFPSLPMDQIVATRNYDGRIEVFGIATEDKRVYHIYQSSNAQGTRWRGWKLLGNSIYGGPQMRQIAVGSRNGRIEVFGLGRDENGDAASVYYIRQTEARTSDRYKPQWKQLISPSGDQIVMERLIVTNDFIVFGLGRDGRIYHLLANSGHGLKQRFPHHDHHLHDDNTSSLIQVTESNTTNANKLEARKHANETLPARWLLQADDQESSSTLSFGYIALCRDSTKTLGLVAVAKNKPNLYFSAAQQLPAEPPRSTWSVLAQCLTRGENITIDGEEDNNEQEEEATTTATASSSSSSQQQPQQQMMMMMGDYAKENHEEEVITCVAVSNFLGRIIMVGVSNRHHVYLKRQETSWNGMYWSPWTKLLATISYV